MCAQGNGRIRLRSGGVSEGKAFPCALMLTCIIVFCSQPRNSTMTHVDNSAAANSIVAENVLVEEDAVQDAVQEYTACLPSQQLREYQGSRRAENACQRRVPRGAIRAGY